jgi:hypothetical protein
MPQASDSKSAVRRHKCSYTACTAAHLFALVALALEGYDAGLCTVPRAFQSAVHGHDPQQVHHWCIYTACAAAHLFTLVALALEGFGARLGAVPVRLAARQLRRLCSAGAAVHADLQQRECKRSSMAAKHTAFKHQQQLVG